MLYPDIFIGPSRGVKLVLGKPMLTHKRYQVVHCTDNDASAEAEANYAKIRTDGTGAHYFVDSTRVVQSTDTTWCVGHVGSTVGNAYGISYEIVGRTYWTRAQWMDRVYWPGLARVMAADSREFGIPPLLLTLDQMRAREAPGVVTHDMCRLAWGGTTHTDPGPNFPMDHLLYLLRTELGDDMNLTDRLDDPALNPGGNNVGQILWGINIALYKVVGLLEEIAPKLGADIDYDSLADKISAKMAATLTPAEIADAISDDVAGDVVDHLVERLSRSEG